MSDIIATVNGQPLRRRDLDNAVQGYALQQYRKTMDQLKAGELHQATELALEKLLARELIYLEALANGIVATVAEVEDEQQRLIANFPSTEEFFATLAKTGISPSDHFRMLRQDLTVNRFSDRHLGEPPEPEPQAIEQAWQEQQGRLRRPERLRAAHLLVRDPGGKSEAARERCTALAEQTTPENFAEQARQYSACPSAAAGGDLGWFRRGDMAPGFEALAFSLPVGAIGGPVATQFGWHLILVLEREEARPLTRQEALPQLRRRLAEAGRARRLQDWVQKLAGRADIRLLDPTLPWPAGLSKGT